MNALSQVVDCVANHGNCQTYLIAPYKNVNYVFEISDDPLNTFKGYVNLYDREFWDGEKINTDAKVIETEIAFSGYDIDNMYEIIAYLTDSTIIHNSYGVLCGHRITNKRNSDLAATLANASVDALDMNDYELLALIQEESDERKDIYIDSMNYYEDTRVVKNKESKRLFKKDFSKIVLNSPDMSTIKEEIAFIEDIVLYTQSKIVVINEILEEINNAKTSLEKEFYISKLDNYCGGENRIIKKNEKQRTKTKN